MSRKSRFRVSPYDAPVQRKLADAVPTYIPILDQNNNQRGHLHGTKSSEVSVSRFGVHNARLSKRNGILAWRGTTATEPTAASTKRVGKIAYQEAMRQKRQARGSATRHPSAPETSARPKR